MEQQNATVPARGNGSADNVTATAGIPGAERPRVISDPNDVATIVMMQIDAVNDRKDELTIAIKGLADLAKQLMRSYSDLTGTVRNLQAKVKELEEKQSQNK